MSEDNILVICLECDETDCDHTEKLIMGAI